MRSDLVVYLSAPCIYMRSDVASHVSLQAADRHEWMDGSTALVLALGKDSVCVANAGDSRAVSSSPP
eukprot:2257433-Rhodomonas_salina.1